MDDKSLSVIVTKARELSPKPLPVKIQSERAGHVLLGQLETHLSSLGFENFQDIEADKNNTSCVEARKGKKLIMGKHGVTVCLRLFRRADGTSSFFVQIQ